MTISTPIHEHTPFPRARLGLTWLLAQARRIRTSWSNAYRRGQLGSIPDGVPLDRYLAPYERVAIPRVY